MTIPARMFLALAVAISGVAPPCHGRRHVLGRPGLHSSVVFRVKHMSTSHAWVGSSNMIAGSFTLDPADPSKSKLAFTVKAASVDTNNSARDKHLQSPDFFNAVQYPDITFASKSVTKSSGGYEVSGTITFHGVHQASLVRPRPDRQRQGHEGRTIAGVNATFTLKQSDFGITKMAAAIGDEVTVFVSIEGVKKKGGNPDDESGGARRINRGPASVSCRSLEGRDARDLTTFLIAMPLALVLAAGLSAIAARSSRRAGTDVAGPWWGRRRRDGVHRRACGG